MCFFSRRICILIIFCRRSCSSSAVLTKFSSSPYTSFPSPRHSSPLLCWRSRNPTAPDPHFSLEVLQDHPLPPSYSPTHTVPQLWNLHVPIRWTRPFHGSLLESVSQSCSENNSSMWYNWSRQASGWQRVTWKWEGPPVYQERARQNRRCHEEISPMIKKFFEAGNSFAGVFREFGTFCSQPEIPLFSRFVYIYLGFGHFCLRAIVELLFPLRPDTLVFSSCTVPLI